MHAFELYKQVVEPLSREMGSWKKCNLLGFMHVSAPCVMSDEVEVPG